jgi:hypothetical protein
VTRLAFTVARFALTAVACFALTTAAPRLAAAA